MTAVLANTDLYQGLSAEETTLVHKAEREIRIASRQAVRGMIAAGLRLSKVKPLLVKNGQWRAWLEANFDSSHDTADRYIAVAERFGSVEAVSSFHKGALYLLTEVTTPPEAADIAIGRANEGETITRAVAEQIVSAFHKAAADMVAEALTTEGSISLSSASVGVVEATEIGPNGEVRNIIRREVVEAGLMETVAETLQYDKDRVIRHIVTKGASLGRVDFIAAGEVEDLEGLYEWLDAARLDGFEGQIFVSVWGIPKHE